MAAASRVQASAWCLIVCFIVSSMVEVARSERYDKSKQAARGMGRMRGIVGSTAKKRR
jgi:hypothetical protein